MTIINNNNYKIINNINKFKIKNKIINNINNKINNNKKLINKKIIFNKLEKIMRHKYNVKIYYLN